jgi:hypothetical protein
MCDGSKVVLIGVGRRVGCAGERDARQRLRVGMRGAWRCGCLGCSHVVRAEEVFPQLRAPILVRRRLPSEVAGVISLLLYAVVGIEGAMGVHVLVEGEPRWLPSPMVLRRPVLVAADVVPAPACVKFGGAGNQDVPSLTVDPSRVLFVNSFRTVDRHSQVHDLGLNGQHGLRWHPGISGGIFERFILL